MFEKEVRNSSGNKIVQIQQQIYFVSCNCFLVSAFLVSERSSSKAKTDLAQDFKSLMPLF